MTRSTKAERLHMATVAALGCVLCRRPAEIHHVRHLGARRNHMDVLPLCSEHHRTGGHGVAIHAGRETWADKHGSEDEWLLWVAEEVGR